MVCRDQEDFRLNLLIFLATRTNGRVLLDARTWRKLWKFNIHERQKVLLWRIVTGAIPSRGCLLPRSTSKSFFALIALLRLRLWSIYFSRVVAKAIWFAEWDFRTESFAHFVLSCTGSKPY
ncbi:hypothetical protein L1049_021433 [Liquidambar formosana]|uniref:Uncharacterized protein n=1 Tax=Liquidambar formosana TaxID=63359 RepID=A0AAP0R2R8_LIQFO